MGVCGRHRASQGPQFLFPPCTYTVRGTCGTLTLAGARRMDTTTAVTVNAALNVVQVCLLAWIAARYPRRQDSDKSGPSSESGTEDRP